MVWESFKLSILVVTVATIVIATLGLALGLLFAKGRFFGRELLASFFTLPLVLPPTVTGFFLIVLFGRHGLIGAPIYDLTGWTVAFTWQAAVIAAVVLALPLMVLSARAAIESVNPQYEIASYTLGKGQLATFFRITLPLARRGIFAGIVLSFTRALGEFGPVYVFAGTTRRHTEVLATTVFLELSINNLNAALAVSLLMIAVAAIVLVVVRLFGQGRTI